MVLIPGYLVTYTGKRLDVINPLPEDICIEAIAHPLSLTCRYGGYLAALSGDESDHERRPGGRGL